MPDENSHSVIKSNFRCVAGMTTLSAIAAVMLGVVARGPNTLRWDLEISMWIQRWRGSASEALYDTGDMLGTTAIAAVIMVIGVGLSMGLKRWQTATFLAAVIALRLLGTQLKPLFDSPRPTADQVTLLRHFDGTGYPSGHSMTIAMTSTVFVVLVWQFARQSLWRSLSVLFAIMCTLLVGWSRIWAGAHWPSDVLGGWGFGFALVMLAWILSDYIPVDRVIRRDMAEHTE